MTSWTVPRLSPRALTIRLPSKSPLSTALQPVGSSSSALLKQQVEYWNRSLSCPTTTLLAHRSQAGLGLPSLNPSRSSPRELHSASSLSKKLKRENKLGKPTTNSDKPRQLALNLCSGVRSAIPNVRLCGRTSRSTNLRLNARKKSHNHQSSRRLASQTASIGHLVSLFHQGFRQHTSTSPSLTARAQTR